MASELEDYFPPLHGRAYRITSQRDDRYNCVGWVVRDTEHWWEPAVDGFFWPRAVDPDELHPDDDLDEYLAVFSEKGFVECVDSSLEQGVEKIAVFTSGTSFSHVAFQTSDGEWSSKMGPLHDIRHQRLEDLIGPPPGGFSEIRVFMSRPRVPHDLADSRTGLLLPLKHLSTRVQAEFDLGE